MRQSTILSRYIAFDSLGQPSEMLGLCPSFPTDAWGGVSLEEEDIIVL